MNKAEKRQHQTLEQQLEKIVDEADNRYANKRGITAQMLVDIKKFAEGFKALGN